MNYSEDNEITLSVALKSQRSQKTSNLHESLFLPLQVIPFLIHSLLFLDQVVKVVNEKGYVNTL